MCRAWISSLVFTNPRHALCAAALVAALALAGCGGPASRSEKLETLPLASVHTTSPQKGLQQVSLPGEDHPNQVRVERFLTLLPRASNLFLGVAKDINGALELALRLDGRSEVVLPKPDDKSQVWLIVFLGFNASSPPQWYIDSVKYSTSKIRVTYSSESPFVQRSRDSHPYFYLIPLKGIRAGTYELELRDAGTKEVVLMRKVRISVSER